jgi:hypothetical protein
MGGPTIEYLRARYPEFADEVTGVLVDCLQEARSHFAGDLDMFLIFLGVASRTSEGPEIKELRLEDVLQGRLDAFPGLWTNVSSLSESLGVPRESVRRKVGELVDLGYVGRAGNRLAITPFASQRFTPLREKIFQMMMRFREIVEQVEARDGRP